MPSGPGVLDPKGQEFELGPVENQEIGTLASRMRRVGIIQIALGCLQVLGYSSSAIALKKAGAWIELLTDLPMAIVFLVAGVLLLGAATPFRSIVDTAGNDMGHLMKACEKLAVVMTVLMGGFAFASVVYLLAILLRLLVK